MSHVHLSEAFLCCDCQCIGNRSQSCACCGSHSLLSLANVLNREQLDVSDCEVEEAILALERQTA